MKILLKYLLIPLAAAGMLCQASFSEEILPDDRKMIDEWADKANWVTRLITAAGEENTDEVSRIVSSSEFNPSMTMTADQGNTTNVPLLTLIYAASVVAGNDHSGQSLRIVLKGGATPNVYDSEGNTPLHMAVGFKYQAPLNLLLEHGADPNIKNHAGVSPLDLARIMKDERVIQTLLNGDNPQ